ncbi:MAG: hypothetical protein JWN90_172 [Parcubacteria group bacterium]|nr:hypothetical protein [Parcubacteria group bacterium]
MRSGRSEIRFGIGLCQPEQIEDIAELHGSQRPQAQIFIPGERWEPAPVQHGEGDRDSRCDHVAEERLGVEFDEQEHHVQKRADIGDYQQAYAGVGLIEPAYPAFIGKKAIGPVEHERRQDAEAHQKFVTFATHRIPFRNNLRAQYALWQD